MNITIFSTTNCGSCHALMGWLDKQNIKYQDKIVDQDEGAMTEFMEVNDGIIGTPFTIIEKDGEVRKIAGFDQNRIKKALDI